jgi:hypothetical protein
MKKPCSIILQGYHIREIRRMKTDSKGKAVTNRTRLWYGADAPEIVRGGSKKSF